MDPLETLRATLTGAVLGPDDAGYDAARAGTLVGGEARPAIVVQAADAGDVARTVAAARESGLELAVRSGGHSGAGHGTTDGGILLDLRGLDAIAIDPDGQAVWAGAGLTAAALSTALGEQGLVVGFGDTGSVGIGGITVGGGVGYLVRAHGLTIDNLLAVELVTADGQVRMVDETAEPDLFWAVRGGGGNFGVATRFRYRTYALPQVTGGMLLLPATADVLEGIIAACEAAPDTLSGIANVMTAPPMPFLPSEHHGRLVIMLLVAYAGVGEAAEAALAPLRALAEPLADLVRPMAYADLFPPEEHGGGEGAPAAVNRSFFVDAFDRDLATLIVDRLAAKAAAGDVLMPVVQLRVLGGAAARVPDAATAYAHRGRRIMGNVAAVAVSAKAAAGQVPWAEALAADISGGDPAAYVNFLMDEGSARVRAAYPGATWDRLVAIKRRHDPTNLFHRNQNIPPQG